MRSKNVLKIVLPLAVVVILCCISIKSFAHNPLNPESTDQNINLAPDVIITIDKNTSEKNFKAIKSMLDEHGITVTFGAIKRNDLRELTGIDIELKDEDNNIAKSSISSNLPIAQITFGRKDNLLFISQSNTNQGALAFFNQPNEQLFNFGFDSIPGHHFKGFKNFNFDNFFNDENSSFFFNGQSLTLDELREQIKNQLGSDSFSHFFNPTDSPKNNYQFFDDPNTNKLIIIDGKESDFKTLDKLAKSNKIEEVDSLKPKTAISIYGDKAQDGAIIVTTK